MWFSRGNPSGDRPYWDICRRVYLVWAIIIATGFIATHFHQLPDINNLWLLLSAIGLGYMGFLLIKVRTTASPAVNRQLRSIGLVWLLTIGFGLALSISAFIAPPLAELSGYLGAFWLGIMAVGMAFNGWVDRSRVYLMIGGIEMLVGMGCYGVEALEPLQYLVAGAVGSLAMVGLILYR